MNIEITKEIKNANCVTHSGTFHADEVFATVILSKLLDNIIIARTNIVENITENQYVYDVGEGKFDHHQFGGNGERKNGIKYSSCGLIWKEFGKDVLNKHKIIEIEYVWNSIDKELIQYIDAFDNGQIPKIETDYRFVHLSKLISNFNPLWNEKVDSDKKFLEAVKFAEIIFDNYLKNIISKADARELVEKAIKESEEGIMILDQFLPWKEFIFESQDEKANKINFVIFPSKRGGFDIYTVPVELDSFESRKLFPKEWAGLRGEDLQKITNVKTARFCHNARFISVAETKEDAIKLAKIACKNN